MNVDKTEWLAALKVGDKVAVACGHFRSAHYDVFTVARITATQIIIEARTDLRYYRANGERIGGRGRFTFPKPIKPVTQEILEMVEGQNLRAWLESVSAQRAALTLPQLRALREAMLAL